MNEEHICCWCGKKFTGYGNNPYPLVKDKDARCCDECNQIVIFERIRQLEQNKKGEDKNESITGK